MQGEENSTINDSYLVRRSPQTLNTPRLTYYNIVEKLVLHYISTFESLWLWSGLKGRLLLLHIESGDILRGTWLLECCYSYSYFMVTFQIPGINTTALLLS